MLKRLSILAISAVVAFFFISCGSKSADTSKPAEAAKPLSDTLTIKNETGKALTELYVSHEKSDKFEENNMIAGATIANGATGSVKKSGFTAIGKYDLCFTDADGNNYYVRKVNVSLTDSVTVTASDKDEKK